jgi:hypothetical protein
MQAILFGLGTVLSPPLAASPPFASPLGLLFRLFRPLFPVGRDRSLKYPSGGVFELEDILSAVLRRGSSYPISETPYTRWSTLLVGRNQSLQAQPCTELTSVLRLRRT